MKIKENYMLRKVADCYVVVPVGAAVAQFKTLLTEQIARQQKMENDTAYTDYKKLDKIVKKKHLIEVVEGIIKAKGITDIVIVPNEDKYNVIIT